MRTVLLELVLVVVIAAGIGVEFGVGFGLATFGVIVLAGVQIYTLDDSEE